LGSWIRRYQADSSKLWNEVIDLKYKTSKPNILYTNDNKASKFFKCFMWVAKAAKMGFRWRVGDEKKVMFCEDNWLGSSTLAIQFWELYVIVNEKTTTIQEPWEGEFLKCTFRGTVGERLMGMWEEVVQLATTICFTNEEDSLIWQFSSNGIYSSQSLYKVINNRGVLLICVSCVELKSPS
jgi:hypothetical protein